MKELTIPLENDRRKPLYEQIYEYVKKDIVKGKLPFGEKLPSTRLLAKHLQVSRSTVELAYEQLLSEGYVETIPCSGYFVCELEGTFPEKGKLPEEMEKEGFQKPEEAVEGKTAEAGEMEQEQMVGEGQKQWQFDFSPYAVEWSEFSMTAWRKSTKRMLQEEMGELFLSGNSMGEENLRQTICDYLHQARGVNCQVSQIIIGAGNEYLLMLLYQMLGAELCVAMESPTYRQAYQIFRNLGWQVAPIRMDENGMRMELLRKTEAQLAYIMPSHQFPLGNVMPMKRRMELLQWAGEAPGRYIIEDDYDSEFRYKGKPIPSLQGSDPYGRVIYLGTFSKSIAPAIRVSYMVLPKELMKLYRERCGFYASTVSRIQQQTLYHFMREGYFERHLNKMRGIYRARHERLMNELKGKSWVKKIYGENAGLHILVEVYTEMREEQVIAAAKERGVRIYGLREYGISDGAESGRSVGGAIEQEAAAPTMLLGYAGLEEEKIAAGIDVLDGILQKSGVNQPLNRSLFV